MPRRGSLREVRAALEREGLLLLADARLPSVTTLVAGGPVRGSWWGHPAGRAIFAVSEALEHGGEALFTRLVAGKVTLVHRRLWRELFAVATAGEEWQTAGLGRDARELLERVSAAGVLRPVTKSERAVARELERRLLAHGASFHTERGAHTLQLESWESLRPRLRLRGRLPPPATARNRLAQAVAGWAGPAPLPWPG